MRKIIAATNMSLDGFCEHTAMTPSEEVHDYYTDLLNSGGDILYGRITYGLMADYWPALVEKPSGTPSMDNFAKAIDRIPKIVFSNTLNSLNWKTARLAKRGLKEEVEELRQQPGKDIFVGSRSLIVSLINLGLLDELQICLNPLILGKEGQVPLFSALNTQAHLSFTKTRNFDGGIVLHYYKIVR